MERGLLLAAMVLIVLYVARSARDATCGKCGYRDVASRREGRRRLFTCKHCGNTWERRWWA